MYLQKKAFTHTEVIEPKHVFLSKGVFEILALFLRSVSFDWQTGKSYFIHLCDVEGQDIKRLLNDRHILTMSRSKQAKSSN